MDKKFKIGDVVLYTYNRSKEEDIPVKARISRIDEEGHLHLIFNDGSTGWAYPSECKKVI